MGEVVAKRSLLRVGAVSGLGVCRKGLLSCLTEPGAASRSRWQLLWPLLRQDNKRVTWFAPMKKLPKNLSPELEELRSGLIGALPLLGNELASMFGRPLPRLSARDKAGLEKKIDRLLRSTSPSLQKLEELKGNPAADLERCAALEQFMAFVLRAGGRRLRLGEDSWEALLRMAAKAAEPPRAKWAQLPAYQEIRSALCGFLVHLYTHAAPAQIFAGLDEWSGSSDARRYVHSVRLLQTACRRFRAEPPKRMTDRWLLELQNEYTLSAGVFETRLRVLLLCAENAEGRPRTWAEWKSLNLNNLLAMAGRHKSLDPVVGCIDRQVRNALVHGTPIIDVALGTCRFEDLKATVTWTWREFFERTRGLTLSVLAMVGFEALQQLIHTQVIVQNIRSSRPAERPVPAKS
jgi:hypothetical protein